MDYKRTYLTFLIGLLCIPIMYSQFTTVGENYNRFDPTIKTLDYSNEPTDGSPYLFKEFSPSKISFIKEICLVNFDAYNNKMEIEKNGKIYYLPQNIFNYDIKFLNSKKTYQLFNYEQNKVTSPGFFQILTKNKGVYLLKKERIRKLEAKKATNGYDQSRPITFKRMKANYYACFENNKAIKIPSKRKHFANLFNNHYKEIITYMKSKKLSYKKEDDLIQIFEYYASIK